MRVIIPFYGSRTAPNALYAGQALVVQIYASEVISRKIEVTTGFTRSEWLKLIEKFDIDTFICGGIDKSFMDEIQGRNICVINNVASEIEEVLQCLIRNKLKPGFGITYHLRNESIAPQKPGTEEPQLLHNSESSVPENSDGKEEQVKINCIECIDKICLEGKSCQLCPLEAITENGGAESNKLLDVALDIASEPERILCRVSELVYFCLGMQYKHIGIAFCTDMWKEAGRIAEILERFFRVTPVCCKVGKRNDSGRERGHTKCNPSGMANTLNLAKPDLNIAIGLSMGCDIIFNRLSAAPVTTLFVKDKLLAHNPVGAVYSKYALEHLEEEF